MTDLPRNEARELADGVLRCEQTLMFPQWGSNLPRRLARHLLDSLAREQAERARGNGIEEILRALIAGDLSPDEAKTALAAENWNHRFAALSARESGKEANTVAVPVDVRLTDCSGRNLDEELA